MLIHHRSAKQKTKLFILYMIFLIVEYHLQVVDAEKGTRVGIWIQYFKKNRRLWILDTIKYYILYILI